MPLILDPLPTFTAHGDPETVGLSIGEAGRDVIVKMLAAIHDRIAQLPDAASKLPDHRAAMATYLHEHFPGEMVEIAGIASGAGVDFEDALLLSTMPSLGELSRMIPHHCSSIVWRHDSGELRLFKTDDGEAYGPDGITEKEIQKRLGPKRIMDLKSGKALRTLAANDIGRVFCETGVNEAGLAIGHSSGRPVLGPQDGKGIPQHMFPGLVLRYCSTVEAAIAFAHEHPVV